MLTKKLYSVICENMCRYSSSSLKCKLERTNYITSLTDEMSWKEKQMLQDPDYFKVRNLFTVEDLFEAKVHYGHKITSLDKRMKPFMFGHRLGYTIFDLDKTAYYLAKALNFVAHIAYRKGVILFISQNPRVTLLVENTANQCKEYAVAREWREGILNDAEKLFKTFVRLPDVCIFLNVKLENNVTHPAVVEAATMCIPTIGIVDSNADPSLITYPVPGNDDSYSALSLYCNLFKTAIARGKKERYQNEAEKSEIEKEVKSDENLKMEEKIKTDENVKIKEKIKTDENVKIKEKIKTDENVKMEGKIKSKENVKMKKKYKKKKNKIVKEKVKSDENMKMEEKVKNDENKKMEEKVKNDENKKMEERVKNDENMKMEENVKSDESIKMKEKEVQKD